jgi:hypothetical protein
VRVTWTINASAPGSLTGHGLTDEERQHLAAIRERFTAAIRFDEDD